MRDDAALEALIAEAEKTGRALGCLVEEITLPVETAHGFGRSLLMLASVLRECAVLLRGQTLVPPASQPQPPLDLLAYMSALGDTEAAARALLVEVTAPVSPEVIKTFAEVVISTMAQHRLFVSQTLAVLMPPPAPSSHELL
jgi:hypothetical protein